MNIILFNAKIHTMESEKPFLEAIAIQNGKIIASGTNEEVLNLPHKNFIIQDMHGSVILPGFTDSHIHLNYYAKSLTQVDCETDNKEECLSRIREKVYKTEPGQWIVGHGWNQNKWSGGYGSIDDLDEITINHPVYLTAKSLHASWANSKAFEIAGINKNTENPNGGIIGRNPNGELSGILFENATQLIEKIIPPLNLHQTIENIEIAQRDLWKFGITSVHDFDGTDCFSALQILEIENKLKIRVLKSIPFEKLNSAIEFGSITGFGSDLLKIGSLKLFADGALGPQTAAMMDPYENNPSNFGVLQLSRDELFEIGKKAVDANISLAVHAIGDFANQTVLDGFNELRKYEKSHNKPVLHHRIEHVQVLNNDLLQRLSSLNITASVQPIHLISDMESAEKYWGTRSQYAYPFRSLLDFGTHLIFGSDSPVESPNPFIGMFAATSRQKLNAQMGAPGWYPEQKISLLDAIKAYTISPALTANWKHYKGRISLNEYADLIVLEDNIFNISLLEIKNLLPSATMVAGEWVWQK